MVKERFSSGNFSLNVLNVEFHRKEYFCMNEEGLRGECFRVETGALM